MREKINTYKINDLEVTVIKTDEKKDIKNLYDHNCLTVEGLNPESIPDWADALYEDFNSNNMEFCVVHGKTINDIFNLTGDNAYPDDLSIVSMTSMDNLNISKVAIKRFSYGGRWFNDIIDNNCYREDIDAESIFNLIS